MKLTYEKSKACCFTGHRPHKLPYLKDEESPQCIILKKILTERILEKVLLDECDTFLCGMAQGVDMICAGLVLELRKMIDMPLRLICVVPYREQAKNWGQDAEKRYREILKQGDSKILISGEYTATCLMERNRYMVDHASHMIAVCGGDGGSKYTLDYARKKDTSIILINPQTLSVVE